MIRDKFIQSIKRKLSEFRTKLLNRNAAVFSVFLLLSFIFWFLNALSKDISGKVKYPVRYINFPEDLALVNELPDRIEIELDGPGYSIVKTKLKGNKTPLIVDVANSGLSFHGDKGQQRSYIMSFRLRETFRQQLRADYDIVGVEPDTIAFLFDRTIRKMVPVRPDIEINTQRQFMVNGSVSCKPDSVEISGPESLVDTITYVTTKQHTFNQLNEKLSKSLNVELIRKVSISHKKVDISIPVEQFTEAIIRIPVTILNNPDTANVKLFPAFVIIQFNVAISDYNKIQDANIKAVVDMEGLDVRSTNKLDVEIIDLPLFASSLKYNPSQLEYIIERK